ncbi:hypothetical protein R1sor_002029 [Riccia sorocarpa]|uniref:Uncharacterized protein n=1 Tax=Riccia sorocarpa TaxID=122646 RepID=A0ABD3H0Q9_9MARC
MAAMASHSPTLVPVWCCSTGDIHALNGVASNVQAINAQQGVQTNAVEPQFIQLAGVTCQWDEYKQGYDPITLTAPARMQHQNGEYQGPIQLGFRGAHAPDTTLGQPPPQIGESRGLEWDMAGHGGFSGYSLQFQSGVNQANAPGSSSSRPLAPEDFGQQSQRSPNGIVVT